MFTDDESSDEIKINQLCYDIFRILGDNRMIKYFTSLTVKHEKQMITQKWPTTIWLPPHYCTKRRIMLKHYHYSHDLLVWVLWLVFLSNLYSFCLPTNNDLWKILKKEEGEEEEARKLAGSYLFYSDICRRLQPTLWNQISFLNINLRS